MNKEIGVWQFILRHLTIGESMVLLIVAASSGSSPGRAGFKMALGYDGQLLGSIGGGVMEMELVEQARACLWGTDPHALPTIVERVHRRDAENASGMICSGRQTVLILPLTQADVPAVNAIVDALQRRTQIVLSVTAEGLSAPVTCTETGRSFEQRSDHDFIYQERIGHENDLYIIGGGHCALALSQLMSGLGFYIRIFDDRSELNTIDKNQFADEITIVDSYDKLGELIPPQPDAYVVVMTLGYASDEIVIRSLIDKTTKYLGVMGSKAKMAVLLKRLRDEGVATDKLATLKTPIGLPINSRTPEEIAVSIAAEIISVKNA